MAKDVLAKLSYSHLKYLNESPRLLSHKHNLDLKEPACHKCLTSIIATISRESRKMENILEMLASGMRIARLNMAHHSHDYHSDTIRLLKAAVAKYDASLGYTNGLAIALELRGPQIHTGFLQCEEDLITLEAGDKFRLTSNKEFFDKGDKNFIHICYPDISNFIFPGHRIILDGGEIVLVARDSSGDNIFCDVIKGGTLKSNKVVMLPNSNVDMPNITEKDEFDIKFAIEESVDMIIVPQIRNAASVNEIRSILGRKGSHILIISKLENKESIENIDEIIDVSDAIMFPRADLSLVIPFQKLSIAQTLAMARCQKKGVPFICANVVLSSMTRSLKPTYSEVVELSGAVSDGVDCVTLTTATGAGLYPVEAVKMVAKLCAEAELASWHEGFYRCLIANDKTVADANYTTALTTVAMAKHSVASAIIVLTTTGRSANLISNLKPRCPILALTRCKLTFRRLKLFRGIIPIYYDSSLVTESEKIWPERVDTRLQYALWVGKRQGYIKTSDAVIIVGPWGDQAGFTNNARLVYAFFEADFVCRLKKKRKELPKEQPRKSCCRNCRRP